MSKNWLQRLVDNHWWGGPLLLSVVMAIYMGLLYLASVLHH